MKSNEFMKSQCQKHHHCNQHLGNSFGTLHCWDCTLDTSELKALDISEFESRWQFTNALILMMMMCTIYTYVPCKLGGCGLLSVDSVVNQEKLALGQYLEASTEP